MSDDDAGQIKDRLTRLEVQVVEKWLSHDKRSDERWADLMEKMHEVANRTTPCTEHLEAMSDFKGRLRSVEKWIDLAGWAIGVVYIGMVGVVIKVVFG